MKRLVELGYYVDMSSLEEKKKTFVRADRKADHIKTRILLLKKRAEEYLEADGKPATFDSTIAWLAVNLKFEPSPDITVARYLAYKFRIHQQHVPRRSKTVEA